MSYKQHRNLPTRKTPNLCTGQMETCYDINKARDIIKKLLIIDGKIWKPSKL
jgi:hypothetical protein